MTTQLNKRDLTAVWVYGFAKRIGKLLLEVEKKMRQEGLRFDMYVEQDQYQNRAWFTTDAAADRARQLISQDPAAAGLTIR